LTYVDRDGREIGAEGIPTEDAAIGVTTLVLVGDENTLDTNPLDVSKDSSPANPHHNIHNNPNNIYITTLVRHQAR